MTDNEIISDCSAEAENMPIKPPILDKNKKAKSMNSIRREQTIFYSIVIALPLLQFLVFYVYVNLDSFALAFQDFNALDGTFYWNNFKNFTVAWEDFMRPTGAIRRALLNSLKAFGLALLLQPIQLLIPYYITKKAKGSELFKVLLFLPSVLSSMVLGLLYQYFVDAVLVEVMAEKFGVTIPAMLYEYDSRFMTAWFYTAWFGMGGNILLMTGAMSQVSDSVIEAAHIDGCSETREFFVITFPLIFTTWSTMFIITITAMFTGGPDFFLFFGTGSDSVQTLGYYMTVKTLNSSGYAGYPLVSAIGLCITVITTPILMVVRKVMQKLDPIDG